MGKGKKFSRQTQADFDTNKLRFLDADLLHSAEITEGGGNFDLLKSTNDKVIGISDLDGDKLEPGVNIAVDRIKFSYGKAAASGSPTAASISYSSLVSAFPPELLRAKLAISQDRKTKLRLPVERFTQQANSPKVQGEEDVLHLGSLIFLEENKPIEIQLEFEDAINAGADKHFVQVRCMGTETASR
ncbi:MAG: hypothetical protein N4A71_11085 [Carboxylicivirga sp.]|nr:hypothetical protein [Carboxylicivirga sp.]